jgi:transposase
MSNLLGLDHWEDKLISKAPTVKFQATYMVEPDTCQKCGVIGRLYRHGSKRVTYRDTPYWGKPTFVQVDAKRYRCRECLATFMQPLPDVDTRRMMFKRCIGYIEDQGIPKVFTEIASDLALNEKTIRNICTPYIKRRLAAWKYDTPVILGIDEVAIVKNGPRYTVFTDIGARKQLDMLEGMSGDRTRRWLSRLPDKERIKIVSIDMCAQYRSSVKAILPRAKIVVDKFHVLRMAGDCMDDVRADARKARKAAGGDPGNPWHGVRLLRKSRHNLSPRQWFLLDGILKNDPLLKAGWDTKEAFYDIWDNSHLKSRKEAEALYEAWLAAIPESVRERFKSIATSVKNWRKEIFAYFNDAVTNAYTEGMNRIIRDIHRDGRGYSFDVIRGKVLLRKSGAPHKQCPNCRGSFPASTFGPLQTHLHVLGNAPQWMRDVATAMGDVCLNCHHTVLVRVDPERETDPKLKRALEIMAAKQHFNTGGLPN